MSFKVGDLVLKPRGYPFPGIVRAVFDNSVGLRRIVVESVALKGQEGGILHIYNPGQLDLACACFEPTVSDEQPVLEPTRCETCNLLVIE